MIMVTLCRAKFVTCGHLALLFNFLHQHLVEADEMIALLALLGQHLLGFRQFYNVIGGGDWSK